MSKKIIKEIKLWTATWDSSVKRYRVRRIVHFKDGSRKLENKPHREYKVFDKDESKIEEYLERENYRQAQKEKAKKQFKVRTSFIKSEDTNKLFEEWMFDRTGNDVYSRNVASSVRRYLIGYFQDKKKQYDYKKWAEINSQNKFVKNLKDKKLAFKTIVTVKNNCNMFFQFLHERSGGNIDLMKFTFPSLTKSGVRKYEKVRKEKAKFKDKRLSGNDYISKKNFKRIFNYCLTEKPSGDEYRYTAIAPFIWLSYHYGLRRSEAMAVNLECLKKEYLKITVQLKKLDHYEELKHGAEERKIPHVFTRKELRKVAGMLKLAQETRMHPSTYTKRWGEVMEALKGDTSFTIHNLRNTFITNCFQETSMSAVEIMYAAGHVDIRTTNKYITDPRQFEAKQKLQFEDLDGFELDLVA